MDDLQSILGSARLGYEVHNSLGLGFWFLAGAAVAAIAGVGLAFLSTRRPQR